MRGRRSSATSRRSNPSDVVFDDLCGLQEYFDALKDSSPGAALRDLRARHDRRREGGAPWAGASASASRTSSSSTTCASCSRTTGRRSRSRWPRPRAWSWRSAWSEKAGVARVVTNEEALLSVGPKTWALPYHVCLSDLLFGEPLYDSRRAMLNLPDPVPSRFSTARRELDGASFAGSRAPPPPPSPVRLRRPTRAGPLRRRRPVALPRSTVRADRRRPAGPTRPSAGGAATGRGAPRHRRRPAPARRDRRALLGLSGVPRAADLGLDRDAPARGS